MMDINLDNELIEHMANEEFEEGESKNNNITLIQNREENLISNEIYKTESIDNEITSIELNNSIINDEFLPTNKNTIKVNKQELKLRKYNIVTTITNKLHINNEKVRLLF